MLWLKHILHHTVSCFSPCLVTVQAWADLLFPRYMLKERVIAGVETNSCVQAASWQGGPSQP